MPSILASVRATRARHGARRKDCSALFLGTHDDRVTADNHTESRLRSIVAEVTESTDEIRVSNS